MSLETYTGYIPSLVVTNPTATDPKAQGDDHLRGVKKTLATTFSGFTEEAVAVTVTASAINKSVGDGNRSSPTGSVTAYAGNIIPQGWLLCNGTDVSRTTYAALFGAIGTTYGAGNGTTTFKLPDLRAYFIRGLDAGRGVDAGRVLGSNQVADNKSHNHGTTVSSNGNHTHTGSAAAGGSHSHTVDAAIVTGSGINGGGGFSSHTNATLTTSTAPNHTHSLTVNAAPNHQHTVTVQNSGSETRPVNVAMNYIIKT